MIFFINLFNMKIQVRFIYPNALRAKQGGSLKHFYNVLWYDVAGA